MRRLACLPLALLTASAAAAQQAQPPDTASWKRGAVCYEIFVRSFQDSDGDGIGDLNGLIQKLDYVNDGNPATQRDLGAKCIWLMPVAESPSYHGYDVSDYYTVERDYGTNDDFKRLVAEAHKRGIKVLIDMVLNHASSQHPHFKEALADTASQYRQWFVFAPKHPGVKNPWGGDNWHKSTVRDEYYYGLFWSGMPDLNYHTPAVREEARKVARFWLQDMGADGFRLDAIPFLVEENGIVQHAPGTHAVLRDYSAYLRSIHPGTFTIGEVWDSTGAMLKYYPDQLDAHFAFEAADAIIAAVRTASAKRLFPAFTRLQAELPAQRWAPFLRNHDQTRTMTELKGDLQAAKLAATLLLTLPGMPFVYYGEEIGMSGDKPDERLRTPMHWARTAGVGFTKGKPWEALQPDSLTANVEAQDKEPNSLLNLYRKLIHLRGSDAALASGQLVPLVASSDSVVAYLRRDGNHAVLVVANLSKRPLTNVRISSGDGAISAGRYAPKPLLAHRSAAPLRVNGAGRIDGYVPLRSVGAMASYLFELAPAR